MPGSNRSNSNRESHRKFTISWSMLLMVVAAGFAAIQAQASKVSSFHADIAEARWAVNASVFECRMVQQIPQLGEAVFYHQAGETMIFFLRTPASPMQAGRALLTSLPPSWRHELDIRDLGYVDVESSSQPVTLDAGRSRLLLTELDRGMMPTLIRRAWYSDDESIQVGLSPVNFAPVIHQYQQCVSDLLPVNFAQIERSTVFWQANQRELNAVQRKQLDEIAAYANADPGVYSFEVNGFTDSSGTPRQNLELSRVRAYAVHNYLVAQGVNEDMIATRYFGSVAEYRIVSDERSAADRDRNRRVTVRLLREGPYPPVTD